MKFRQHQHDVLNLCNAVAHGQRHAPELLVADVIPGGGKSLLPVLIALKWKEAGLIDRLCWIVPRLTLQEQAAKNFIETQSQLRHTLEIRESTNEVNPSGHLTGCDAAGCCWWTRYPGSHAGIY